MRPDSKVEGDIKKFEIDFVIRWFVYLMIDILFVTNFVIRRIG